MKMMQWLKITSLLIYVGLWVLSFDFQSFKWAVLSSLIFLTPLFTIRKPLLFSISCSIAFLMGLQVLGGLCLQKSYHHLTPSLSMDFEVQGLRGVEGVQHLSTDEKGFRVLPPFRYSEHKEFRVLALGASTTEQIYLGDEKTWTAILEKALEKTLNGKVKVINAGVSGLSVARVYENLKYGKGFEPDVVLVLVGVNDWMLQVRRAFDRGLSLGEKASLIQRDLGLEGIQLKKSPFVRLAHLWRDSMSNRNSSFKQPQIVYGERIKQAKNSLERKIRFKYLPQTASVEFLRYLERIAGECKNAKFKCYFLTQPYGYTQNPSKDYLKSLWMTPADTPYTLDIESVIHLGRLYNKTIRTVAFENKISVCELEDKLKHGFESFYDDVHFNIAGAAQMGDFISKCINADFNLELAESGGF